MNDNNLLEAIANRVFASWKTTLVSAIILAATFWLGYTGEFAWPELLGWFTTGGVFLFVRDGAVVQRETDKAVRKALEDPQRADAYLQKRGR